MLHFAKWDYYILKPMPFQHHPDKHEALNALPTTRSKGFMYSLYTILHMHTEHAQCEFKWHRTNYMTLR